MGITKVTVSVTNVNRSVPCFEDLFLVDTGAIDCMASSKKLEEVGIEKVRKKVYELANGETVEYYIGYAIVAFLGSETVVQIIFGSEDSEPILGAVALENVDIAVDPARQTLKKMPAAPLKVMLVS